MEASHASNSTPQAGTGTEDAAVGSHCWNLAAAKVLKEDGALAVLMKSLSQEHDLALQRHAAETSRNLSAAEDRDTKVQILNEEGILKGLVKCLCKTDILGRLRKIAADTLGILAAAHDNCFKIVGIGGALEESLFVHGNASLQEQGARALSMLARQSGARIVIVVAHFKVQGWSSISLTCLLLCSLLLSVITLRLTFSAKHPSIGS